MAFKFTSAQISPNMSAWKIKLIDFILYSIPILGIKRANKVMEKHEALKNAHFIKAATKDLKINIIPSGFENITKSGPLTIAANHPGGADVIAAIQAIGEVRPDMQILANELICVGPVKEIVIPVKMSGKQKVDEKLIDEAYKAGKVVVFFAAGKNSRYNDKGELVDRRWRTSFLNYAKKYDTPIHIMRINDANTPLFYKVSRIRMRYKKLRNIPLENLFQLRELMYPKSELKIMLSKPISTESLQATENVKEMRMKADKLYNFLYEMDENNLEFKNTL